MLVFIHINKTAGSTVRYMLRSSYGARHCDVEPWTGSWDETSFSTPDLRLLRRLYPKLASIAGHRVTGHADLEEDGTDIRYFTILRDPVRMTASRFQYHVEHRKKKGLVFHDWIQNEWLRNAQTKRIAGSAEAAAAIELIRKKGIFVGLTECFDESMVLLKGLRAEDLEIGYTPVNVAKRNTLAKDLLADPKAREALVDANAADLELYSYVRDELFPSFRREYGPSLEQSIEAYKRAQPGGWSRRNVTACRLKRYLVYKPALRLYRGRWTGGVAERALGANHRPTGSDEGSGDR